MGEPMLDEAALRDAEAEASGASAAEVRLKTHAAKWDRPLVQDFECKDKTITFQVSCIRCGRFMIHDGLYYAPHSVPHRWYFFMAWNVRPWAVCNLQGYLPAGFLRTGQKQAINSTRSTRRILESLPIQER